MAENIQQAAQPDAEATPVIDLVAEPGATTEGRGRPGGAEVEARTSLLEAGTLINGRYRVAGVLGKGGMGIVYRVFDGVHADRALALKTILGSGIDAEHIALFKSEFQIMNSLRHENVIQVHDFEAIQGTPDFMFTADLVEGRDLLSATEGLSWDRVLPYLVQVCRALSYLHSRGIIHFDIKPANVLVDAAGMARVLDFGIAGLRKAMAGRQVSGTPAYMAPELFKGGPVDHRADLYSLGIMTYELFARGQPYQGLSWIELVTQALTRPLTFEESAWEGVPSWLRDLLLRLCAKEPDQRFPTANAVIEAMNREGGLAYEVETLKTRESYLFSSRFVGRTDELLRVDRFVSRRTDGSTEDPRILLVAGPTGIGKSRLMREVRHRAQLARLSFVEANCYEGAFSEYAPVAELLSYLLRQADAHGAGDLVLRHGPELARIAPDILAERGIAPSPSLDNPEGERLRMLRETAEFVVQVARLSRVVLYFNDLHWAAAGTTDFLRYLVRRLGEGRRAGEAVPLCLLGSYRDDEIAGRPAQTLLKALAAEGASDIVELRTLGEHDVGTLLQSMLGLEGAPPEFTARIAQETGGNPFFVEEVMRILIQNGTVYLKDGAWAVRRRIDELDIPASISAVVLRRASALDPRERGVLDMLAVSSRPVTPALLRKAGDLSAEDLNAALRILERHQMAAREEGTELRYHLAHAKMREALYEALPEDRRQGLHAALGLAIEAGAAGDLSRQTFELAHHFWCSHDRERALRYGLSAGRQAKAAFANDLAIEWLRRSASMIESANVATLDAGSGPQDGGELRLQILEDLGDALALKGRFAESIDSFEQVLGKRSQIVEQARLQRKIGRVHFQRGELALAVERLWRALTLLGASRPHSLLGVVWITILAFFRYAISRVRPARSSEAAGHEHQVRDHELVLTYNQLGHTYFWYRPNNMAMAFLRSANVADRLPPSLGSCAAFSSIATVFGTIGLSGWAREALARARGIAALLESPYAAAYADAHAGHVAFFEARWEEALVHYRAARDGFTRCGDLGELALANAGVYYCLYCLGRIREALECTDEIMPELDYTGATQFGKSHFYMRGRTLSKLGRDREAVESASYALKLSIEADDLTCICKSQFELGDIHLTAGRFEEAIEFLEQARKTREQHTLLLDHVFRVYPLLANAYLALIRRDLATTRPTRHPHWSRAVRAVRRAERRTRKHPSHRPLALLNRAMLEALAGRSRKAHAGFSEAMALADHLGAELYGAKIRIEFARFLVTTDPSRAAALLGEAREPVARREAGPLFAQIRELEERLA